MSLCRDRPEVNITGYVQTLKRKALRLRGPAFPSYIPACAARPDWARVYDDFANDRYDDAEHLIGIIVGTGTTLTDEVQGKLSGALERAIDNDRYDDAERLHGMIVSTGAKLTDEVRSALDRKLKQAIDNGHNHTVEQLQRMIQGTVSKRNPETQRYVEDARKFNEFYKYW